jgi:hypothetical protein
MPLFYLQHPVHGIKIASMDAEVEHDQQNGWELFEPDTPSDNQAAPVEQEVTNQLPRRRGKSSATKQD